MTLNVIMKASCSPSAVYGKTANQRGCPVHFANHRFAMNPSQA